MGYTTDFYGSFQTNKPMSEELMNYINKFGETRRMKRDVEKIKEIFPNWKELCFNGELGVDGEYFIGGGGCCGQDHDESIIDYNRQPTTQPGLWCQWMATDANTIEWDGGEKFYYYSEWLQYIIDNFLTPNGIELSGAVEYFGEDYDDRGIIEIENGRDVVVTEYEVVRGRSYFVR